MGSEAATVAPQTLEVPMVEAEAVRQMRDLASKGWGAKRIARELGLARNTVRRYLRGGGSRGSAAQRFSGTATARPRVMKPSARPRGMKPHEGEGERRGGDVGISEVGDSGASAAAGVKSGIEGVCECSPG